MVDISVPSDSDEEQADLERAIIASLEETRYDYMYLINPILSMGKLLNFI